MKRIYLDVEIQNVENPGYAPLTRGNDYLSRMITSQNGKEYDYRNYDGMKKAYVIWILPQAAKKRDGHVNRINSKLENIKDKYEDSDWIKTPLVIFLNNTYDLLIKKEVMKEYGFEEIEKEVKKMCNLGEMIARENIEKGHSIGLEQGLVQGQKLERRKKNIELITNLMNSLSISFSKAVELLKVSEDEVLEIKKYFEA